MAATYEKIATTTLGSAAADVTFSSISSAYTDLVIVGNGSNSAGSTLGIQFNSDTGSNYSNTSLYGSGSSAASLRNSNSNEASFVNWYTTFNNTFIINIQNYSNTTTYKTFLARGGNASNFVWASVASWRSTSAITSVKINANANFSAGSTFTLYGILKAA